MKIRSRDRGHARLDRDADLSASLVKPQKRQRQHLGVDEDAVPLAEVAKDLPLKLKQVASLAARTSFENTGRGLHPELLIESIERYFGCIRVHVLFSSQADKIIGSYPIWGGYYANPGGLRAMRAGARYLYQIYVTLAFAGVSDLFSLQISKQKNLDI